MEIWLAIVNAIAVLAPAYVLYREKKLEANLREWIKDCGESTN